MKNTLLIIQREYLTRVQKPAFLILTFLVPTLMIGVFGFVIWLGASGVGKHEKTFAIIDESGFIKCDSLNQDLNQNKLLKFDCVDQNLKEAIKGDFGGYNGFIYFAKQDLDSIESFKIYVLENLPITLEIQIRSVFEGILEKRKLSEMNIDYNAINKSKTRLSVLTKKLSDEGERDIENKTATIVGYAAGFFMYMAMFLYGGQVMQGVMEEKTNRIVEVLFSSVKPIELMIGKIIGVALLGITQIGLWAIFMFSVSNIGNMGQQMSFMSLPQEAQDMIASIDIAYTMSIFLVYYLLGYLVYSSMFAMVGAIIENQGDAQQYMTPIIIPIILAMLVSSLVVQEPNGSIAFWFSMFPLTSPVIMLFRLPFLTNPWELGFSILILILSLVGIMSLAAKVYKIGILMYGKKLSIKEIRKLW